ncbi:ComF family protein [Pedobacter puniceum]|uniref:ComF family protein n=1 Tax=Pedobacter puniceum TaxID=2666136 RepID=A0A7K0FRP4_9SPHI|nr:phosphoribosyltransferase family protein [Pedobacter puniceum]MRX48678.1 ComF family protein [Pedobacter puniceum]
MNLAKLYLKDFWALFFPKLCHTCGTPLLHQEYLICTTCLYQLPFTDYHLDDENKLVKQFWGKVHVKSATAYLFFSKEGKVQNLMHQLKYNNHPEIGVELGKMYGKILRKQQRYQNIEAIIPVPLHPSKQRKRGYNQSEQFALGLSESLSIPVLNHVLKRVKSSDSQIFMKRESRFYNMQSVFEASQNDDNLKSVLLVDDTITTGATLEACVLALEKAGIHDIHIAGIAFAS